MGRIISDGSLDELRKRVSIERRLVVDLEDGDVPEVHPGTVVRSFEAGRVDIRFDPDVVSATELISDVTSRNRVRDIFVENPPIEELIARIYEGEGRGR